MLSEPAVRRTGSIWPSNNCTSRRSASTFMKAYQSSRLASLPRRRRQQDLEWWDAHTAGGNFKEVDDGQKMPMAQVLYTTPALNFRKEFGLKRSMPQPLNSRYIVANALDTPFGFTDYEPGAGKALALERLRSLEMPAIPIPRKTRLKDGEERTDLNPLFFGKTDYKTKPLSREQVMPSLKSTGKTIYDLRKEDAIKLAFTPRTSAPDASPVATAGFSYTLPGVLRNRPEGVTNQMSIRARTLDKNGRLVAAAGMIGVNEAGRVDFAPSKSTYHRDVKDMAVDRFRVNQNGQISMYLRPAARHAASIIEKHRGNKFVETRTAAAASNPERNSSNAYYDLIKKTLYS